MLKSKQTLLIGGGGGWATNLWFTASSTNGIVTSDTWTDATIPLWNGTNSGLSLNDYTTAEKSKLAGIEAWADVTDATNVDAAWAVMNSDYTPSHSLLVQQSGTWSPSSLSIPNDTILGRLSGWGSDIDALTPAEVRTLINVADWAEVNVNADWNSISGDSQILNKPTIPTQYTDELAQDAVWTILVDSSEIDFTYNDATPSITASIVAGSIDETKLDASVNASLDLADSAVQPSWLTNYFNKTVDDTDDITVGTTNKFATAWEKTKLWFISVTQAVDLDTIESDTATNNAKVTNATHTGEVTGSTALTVDPTAISNKTAKTSLVGTEEFLINDGGTLKKVTASNLPAWWWSGDVTAAAAFSNDNRIIRSDGTWKWVQASDVVLDDNGRIRLWWADGSAMVDIIWATSTVQWLRIQGDATSALSFSTYVAADWFLRFNFLANGQMQWWSGAAPWDTNLYRSAANTLKTDDKFEADGWLKIGTSSTAWHVWTATDTAWNWAFQAPSWGGSFNYWLANAMASWIF